MKTKAFTLFILLSITLLTLSCGKNSSGKGKSSVPAVTVQSQHLSDKSGFTMSNGDRCTIVAEATIDYPVKAGKDMAIDSLQRLFAAYVLESGDSLSLSEAMKQVVSNSMHQYDFMVEPISEDEKMEVQEAEAATLKYATSTRISPIYNKNGVVTFERVDVVKKNDKVTSVTHRYYSFDVETQSFIDLNRLFRDDAMADVCQLLKQQLLAQNNATGNEQLNDLGYFNVENISVSRNFYFDDEGVTWSYLPNELAVEAVGEPRIFIKYGDLDACKCDDSLIDRLK
ncbi:MAG: DUF3298 domain-containing protein [Muribaculaceae bacterium]|nr:DUF3298 domain-containing protein [Muribaculaceae bacterium]